nr:hypothetical protein Iba_chr13eCG1680 [Ipomoea batatas]
MGKKLSQVCLTTKATLFLISLVLIFVITAAQGGPGKIAVRGHSSPGAHSAVGQNPPSQHSRMSYKTLERAPVCERRYRGCIGGTQQPKPVCSKYMRGCVRN